MKREFRCCWWLSLCKVLVALVEIAETQESWDLAINEVGWLLNFHHARLLWFLCLRRCYSLKRVSYLHYGNSYNIDSRTSQEFLLSDCGCVQTSTPQHSILTTLFYPYIFNRVLDTVYELRFHSSQT